MLVDLVLLLPAGSLEMRNLLTSLDQSTYDVGILLFSLHSCVLELDLHVV
jgi:hypothetical protein